MCQVKSYKLPQGTYTCYKVVVKKKIGGKLEFRSPYRNCKYKVGETYEIKRGSEPGGQAVYDTLCWVTGPAFYNHAIDKKAIHSFAFLEDAQKFCDASNKVKGSRNKRYILKCEIPQNAVYAFLGEFTYQPSSVDGPETVKSYASSALKVLEVVDCAGDE